VQNYFVYFQYILQSVECKTLQEMWYTIWSISKNSVCFDHCLFCDFGGQTVILFVSNLNQNVSIAVTRVLNIVVSIRADRSRLNRPNKYRRISGRNGHRISVAFFKSKFSPHAQNNRNRPRFVPLGRRLAPSVCRDSRNSAQSCVRCRICGSLSTTVRSEMRAQLCHLRFKNSDTSDCCRFDSEDSPGIGEPFGDIQLFATKKEYRKAAPRDYRTCVGQLHKKKDEVANERPRHSSPV
jgi:hypothetical protein